MPVVDESRMTPGKNSLQQNRWPKIQAKTLGVLTGWLRGDPEKSYCQCYIVLQHSCCILCKLTVQVMI
jgi:hypothetical protein